MIHREGDSSEQCLYHKATVFRVKRLEARMNRIEKFILSMLIYLAIFQMAIILNLPQKLMEHENRATAEERR
jgi:hypothetical protein